MEAVLDSVNRHVMLTAFDSSLSRPKMQIYCKVTLKKMLQRHARGWA